MKTCHWVVLALGAHLMGAAGWYQAGLLAEGREELRMVRDEAMQLGIGNQDVIDPRSRPRANHGSKASQSAGQALAHDVVRCFTDASRKGIGAESYEDLMVQVEQLTLPQVRSLIDGVQASGSLDRHQFSRFVAALLRTFSQSRPGDALVLSFDFEPLDKHLDEEMPLLLMKFLRPRAFRDWAEDDPMGALDWVRGTMAANPEWAGKEIREELMRRIAPLDRKLALGLIKELELPNPAESIQCITSAPKTAEERLAAIADVRSYLATLDDEQARDELQSYALASLGRKVAGEGFDKAVAIAEAAGFDFVETTHFTWHLWGYLKKGEEGLWADWLSTRQFNGRVPKSLHNLIWAWTGNDYQAVAKWLNGREPGIAKNAAIVAFTEKLAWYEPAAAAGWAATLPAGERRDAAMRQVYKAWSQNKPEEKAAADAFADRHGVPR